MLHISRSKMGRRENAKKKKECQLQRAGDLDPTLPQPPPPSPPEVLSNVTTVHTINRVF